MDEVIQSDSIKQIVDVKTAKDGTKYFRICWRDTWEHQDNLVGCETLLNEFMKSKDSQPEPKSPKVIKDSEDVRLNNNTIQCDLINTTTSKPSNIQSQSKQRNVIPIQQHDSTYTSITEQKNQGLETVKQAKPMQVEFGQQFISSSDSPSEEQLFLNEEEIFTREVACQSEPDVRHFSIQTHTTVEKVVEYAEIAVQVEPSVFSISTQYSSLGTLRPNYTQQCMKRTKKRPAKEEIYSTTVAKKIKTNSEISTISKMSTKLDIDCRISPGKVDNFEESVDTGNVCVGKGISDVDESEMNDNVITELVCPTNNDHNTEIEKVENIVSGAESSASMYIPPGCNYVELDYSNIPADILQQILLKTNPPGGSQPQTNNAMENVGEELKAMYFIVDGAHGEGSNSGLTSENKTTQQMILQENVMQQNKVKFTLNADQKTVSNVPQDSSTINNRKKKAKTGSFKKPNQRNFYSRNLFPSDNESDTGLDVNRTLMKSISCKKKENVYPAIKQSTVGAAAPSPQKTLNESNVSTVYDPNSPSLPEEKDEVMSSTKEKNMPPIKFQESEQINEDFISRYWKNN
uniref:Chromo domain-containing protein n=2 Tax=Clytia hemisphaerica TaxID=252671 RepID=A0A7M5UHX3_9CNID